jgi:hypothetical protein
VHFEIESRCSFGVAAAKAGMDLSACAFEMVVVNGLLMLLCWRSVVVEQILIGLAPCRAGLTTWLLLL